MIASLAWTSASGITYRKVVDTVDAPPTSQGTWEGFYNPAISNGNVAFLAYRPAYSPLSLFAEFDGKVVHAASHGDTIPGDGRTISKGFETTSYPLFHGGRVYWDVLLSTGDGSSPGVVEYGKDGLRLAFDNATVNAHAGVSLSWYSYHHLSIGPGDQVVRALSGPGIQSSSNLWLIGFDGTKLSTVNAGTSLPPSTTRFTQDYAIYQEGFVTYQPNESPKFRRDHLGSQQILDAGLAELFGTGGIPFVDTVYGNGRWFATQVRLINAATGETTAAIAGWAAGKWFEIIRTGGSAHDGTAITGLSDIGATRHSLDRNSLLFTAGTANGEALFLFRHGEVRRLVGVGDWIDNRKIVSLLIGRNSLEGDRFAFVVRFTDGRCAVYAGDMSVLYPSQGTSLKCGITLTNPHVGEVTFPPTLENRVYHFLQSDDLKRSAVIKSSWGGPAMTAFTFNNSLEAPKQRFYWIEEAIYTPGAP